MMNQNHDATNIKRYLFSFDHAPIGIVWHDSAGKIIRVNQYAANKLGYSAEELMGNYLYKFVVLDRIDEIQSYYKKLLIEHSTSNLFTKHGKVIPVQVVVHGATTNEGDFGCAFFTDLTEKIRLTDIIAEYEQGAATGLTSPLPNGANHFPADIFRNFIGKSRAIGEVFKLICRVAQTPTTVLILGETGTGKELVARKIHELSSKKDGKLVKVNCATLPAHLIEGELFGHEKGAFTGAHSRKPGRFELANGGTIFLDEIGEMSMELQAKLLRVLQEGEFERLGGTATLKVDVRVVAATNKNLPELVGKGKFRQDLYFRLSIFPINLPSLRSRKEDIPLLTEFFTRNFCKTLNRGLKAVTPEFIGKLDGHDWPGNVRELQNVVERACILSTNDSLDADKISLSSIPLEMNATSQPPTFEENERRYIKQILNLTQGRIFGADGAAAIMQINPRTLTSKMKKLKIDKSTMIFE